MTVRSTSYKRRFHTNWLSIGKMHCPFIRSQRPYLYTPLKTAIVLMLCASTGAKPPVTAINGTENLPIVVDDKELFQSVLTRAGNSCASPVDRYPGLLLSADSIEKLATHNSKDTLFKIGHIANKVEISQTSDIPQSLNVNTATGRLSSFADSCSCETHLYFISLRTVASVYSGRNYTVKTYNGYYQPIMMGECESLGATCSYKGTCRTEERLVWILVDKGHGLDMFVPVSIPSHCYCRFQ